MEACVHEAAPPRPGQPAAQQRRTCLTRVEACPADSSSIPVSLACEGSQSKEGRRGQLGGQRSREAAAAAAARSAARCKAPVSSRQPTPTHTP